MFWFCLNVALIGKTNWKKVRQGKGRAENWLQENSFFFFFFLKPIAFLARDRIYYTEYCFFLRVDKRIKQTVKTKHCNKQCTLRNFWNAC